MNSLTNPPGVIKCVPFSRVGIATIGCVVTAHSGAWVVGHCIQVVHCIYYKRTKTRHVKLHSLLNIQCCTLSQSSVLTAVFRGKLPQVEIFHGEVNEGGQFAGSSCLREAFQVWGGRGVKEQHNALSWHLHSCVQWPHRTETLISFTDLTIELVI